MLQDLLNELNAGIKSLIDALSVVGATVGILGFLNILSGIITVLAALASLAWSWIRIWEWWTQRKKDKQWLPPEV